MDPLGDALRAQVSDELELLRRRPLGCDLEHEGALVEDLRVWGSTIRRVLAGITIVRRVGLFVRHLDFGCVGVGFVDTSGGGETNERCDAR